MATVLLISRTLAFLPTNGSSAAIRPTPIASRNEIAAAKNLDLAGLCASSISLTLLGSLNTGLKPVPVCQPTLAAMGSLTFTT
jgi:purine nucleoside phosphorylase